PRVRQGRRRHGQGRRQVQRCRAACRGRDRRRVRAQQRRVRRHRTRSLTRQPGLTPTIADERRPPMGIMSFIKSQFIEIIEWLDDTNYTLVWRFPDEDHEIKNGAKLVCRAGQACILVNEGKAADVFGPGTHTLSTQNIPVISRLRGWKYGFSSPFKAEVYFVNLRQYLDQKWGTANPVLIRDPEFAVGNRPGRVRIRAYGSYNFRIVDPRLFFDEVVGTQGMVASDEIEGYLRRRLVSAFSQAAGRSELSVADMATNYDVLARAVMAGINEDFAKLGLALTTFIVENISLPPEVEKALDAAAAQSARGVDNTLAW